MFATLAAARAGDRSAVRLALVAGWIAFLWLPAALGITGAPTVLAALAIAAWLLVLLAAAEGMRVRRERAMEAQRARELVASRQADEERLRIARELHDVLAHSISLISVQSGVALHLIDERPEQARTALAAINNASAEALREVRSVLGVLRGTGEHPPRALTNVVRHAGAATATVTMNYGSAALTVQVEDEGRGGDGAHSGGPSLTGEAEQGSGSGIAGMRERAAALGGTLDAAPLSPHGFRVRARLPLSPGGER